MSQSTSLCSTASDTLSTLSCKLHSAGCSVVRGVLDLLMMPSGNQRLLGWLGNHLLSIAGQLGNSAPDLIPAHPMAAGSLLAAIACAVLVALRRFGSAVALAVLMPVAAYGLILQLPAEMAGSVRGVEFLLIAGLLAVGAAFHQTAH
ncbi:hypothetical protein GBZ48_27835 [Azospirillum melinis]|uniref:Uncharacterized protein n=1 Tax=Azospirillum melinis TaxID=328839 RepID=A0ABX2KHE1_9PROT|nr:hypothetical protein [Azospirillum melinis]MBP2308531.1 hypothetical protein [Azospirillum melinis]NUB03048.1 hypothetical protein [Azospirillum melinis]